MVVPFAAGGTFDVLGRIIAARMAELLGQSIVVENVTGAGGIVGVTRVINSAPDGYTLLLGTVGTAVTVGTAGTVGTPGTVGTAATTPPTLSVGEVEAAEMADVPPTS